MSIIATVRHLGPGPHPAGSPQSVHGKDKGGVVALPSTSTTGGSGWDETEFAKMLREEKPTSKRGLEGASTDDCYILTYKDGTRVCWKPMKGGVMGNQDGNSEIIAYRLSHLLGLDNVPETVFMNYNGAEGTASEWVVDAKDGFEVVPTPEQGYRVLITSLIIGNPDMRRPNYLTDGAGKTWGIDFGVARWVKYQDMLDFPARTASGLCRTGMFAQHVLGDKPIVIPQELKNTLKKLTREDYDTVFEGTKDWKWVKPEIGWQNIQDLANSGEITFRNMGQGIDQKERHLGPGPHPGGTPQKVHEGQRMPAVAGAVAPSKVLKPTHIDSFVKTIRPTLKPEVFAQVAQEAQALKAESVKPVPSSDTQYRHLFNISALMYGRKGMLTGGRLVKVAFGPVRGKPIAAFDAWRKSIQKTPYEMLEALIPQQ